MASCYIITNFNLYTHTFHINSIASNRVPIVSWKPNLSFSCAIEMLYAKTNIELHWEILYNVPAVFQTSMIKRVIITNSYTLSCEYRVVRNPYSWLFFTSEDCLCTNLRVQEQLTNMTSQCGYPMFAWRHRSTVVKSQCWVRKDCL